MGWPRAGSFLTFVFSGFLTSSQNSNSVKMPIEITYTERKRTPGPAVSTTIAKPTVREATTGYVSDVLSGD
jgi:hypothetical protein